MSAQAVVGEVVPLVIDSLRQVAEQQSVELPEELSRETQLFGPGGLLDSLGLVTLVVAVERTIQDRLGASVVLSDDRAMSQKRSPFRTIESLASYAAQLIEEAQG